MRKSDEIKGDKIEFKEYDELPVVDYSKIPDEVEEVINKQPYVVEGKAKVTWDGKQFLVRIPSEIANEMKITTEYRMLFKVTKPLPDSDDTPELEMKLEKYD